MGIGYDFLVVDTEVHQFTAEANSPLLGFGKLRLDRGSPPCLERKAFPCLSLVVEEL
jgi:hypothetical protein